MAKMRVGITAAVVAALSVAATASGATPVGEADERMTTGRALIAVRTPALPTGDGRAAGLKRDARLDRSHELLQRVAQRNGIEVEARSDAAGLLATGLDETSVAELRAQLASDPLVEGVRLEGSAEFRYTPSDPFLGGSDPHAPGGDTFQWPLLLQSFPKAWDMSKGVGPEVAVIDSGADISHPDLAARITGSLNCAGVVCLGADVSDTFGHGTHVSGLACADSDNAFGLASGGFDCSLYVIKVSSGGPIPYTAIINSIYAAANHGSDVINMSFGGGAPDGDLRDAIDFALARGATLVAAGDNEPNPPPSYPAQYLQAEGTGPDIETGKGLVVTSVSHTGLRSAFAQSTSGVSVAAVGSASDLKSCQQVQQGILSTWPANATAIESSCAPIAVRTSLGGDDRFGYLVGTSMASPQVAGLAALMRAVKPGITAAKVTRLLKLTASNCGQYANGIGWGLIRADQAVAGALDKDADPPSSHVRRATVVPRGAAAIAVRKSGRGNIGLRLKRSDPTCSKELKASGVKSISVFASANGGRYRRIAKTKKKKIFFRGKPRRRYRFYSVAVDKGGNREAPPETADAKLRIKKKRKR